MTLPTFERFKSKSPRARQSHYNDAGFSLIEALITVGILSITALVSATLISDMATQSLQSRRNIGRSTFEQELVGLFRDTNLCSCNIGSAVALAVPAVGSVRVPALKKSCGGATNDFYEYNAANGFRIDSQLAVSDITITNPQVVSGNNYSAELNVTYSAAPTSLKMGRYLILFEKTAAAGPPYIVSTCNIAGALSGPTAGWRLGGNSGIDPALDFFGTNDNADINFRRNNQVAGSIRVNSTSLGAGSLLSLTTGTAITSIGSSSMVANTSGSENTAVGFRAMANNTTGVQNTAIGSRAMINATNGGNSVAVGFTALAFNQGSANVAVGSGAMSANTTGDQNIAVGFEALSQNTTGQLNTALGTRSLTANSTGSRNTAAGYRTNASNTSGSDNSSFGYQSLLANTTGSFNSAFGTSSLAANTDGIYNTAMGYEAMSSNVDGSFSTAVGYEALRAATSGSMNTAVGTRSLRQTTTGGNNTAIGREAMRENTEGGSNVAVGGMALQSNVIGVENVAIGSLSLSNNIGNQNTAVGTSSQLQGTTGIQNSSVGYLSMSSRTTGSENSSLGALSLSFTSTGDRNVAIGNRALHLNQTGSRNTAVGFEAGLLGANGNQSGNDNVYLGNNARPIDSTPISNAIAIGSNAVVSASNTMVLGGTGAYAVNVGIGLTSASYQLQLSNDSAAKPGSSTWTVASDARLKDVRAPFTRGLDALESLQPIYYRYKLDNALGLPHEKEFVGVIAQDAQKAVPESVNKSRDGFLHVETDSIIWTMLNAIKELYKRWWTDSLEIHAKLDRLEKENEQLKLENRKILLRLEKLEQNRSSD